MTFMGLIHKQVKHHLDMNHTPVVNIRLGNTTAVGEISDAMCREVFNYSDGMIYHRVERGGYIVSTKCYSGSLTY